MFAQTFVKVAVPCPLYGLFDYRLDDPQLAQFIQPGCRVQVPFGRQSVIGLVMQVTHHSELAANKLKPIQQLLDNEPLLPGYLLDLLQWAADYYHYPLGEIIASALPKLLRQGGTPDDRGENLWQLTDKGRETIPEVLRRAPRQAALLQQLQQLPAGLTPSQLNLQSDNWRPAMKGLLEKQLVSSSQSPCLTGNPQPPIKAPQLHDEQQAAVDSVAKGFGAFHTFLLQGITGSGKTEVYLALVEQVIAQHKQVLILVPEISLTPQLTHRFQQRLSAPVASLHSGMNDRQRLCAWTMAASNQVPVVIGTRSALFTPMPALGLIIIDEEHDASLKQQEGFRYHARDLALVRAKNAGIPVLLGSATPSLESLNNALKGQYHLLKLRQRASRAIPPKVHLLDICRRPLVDGLSDILVEKIRQHLAQQGQVMLFLNRRGYAPLLMCHDCGWSTDCPRCDAHMTLHHHNKRLQCHHCGHERSAPETCPECQAPALHIPGAGTERIEEALRAHFPDISLSRIDRDTTRRKGSLDEKLKQAQSGESRILIGTQMLAKGHDFPNLTLVGILDTDQGLFSADFRGAEHMAQLIVQVSGRAGRGEKPGEVYIQTHHPEHPLLHTLLHQGYEGFARAALEERKQAPFPPFTHLAVIRAEASTRDACHAFLQQVSQFIHNLQLAEVEHYGPLPAPMEKRAGRFRAQLIIQASERRALHHCLKHFIAGIGQLKLSRQVRWSLDVDPQDMY